MADEHCQAPQYWRQIGLTRLCSFSPGRICPEEGNAIFCAARNETGVGMRYERHGFAREQLKGSMARIHTWEVQGLESLIISL